MCHNDIYFAFPPSENQLTANDFSKYSKFIKKMLKKYRIIKFLEQGYEVFKNVSSSGPIDMVLVHHETGEVRLIDVKTTSRRTKSWRPGSKIVRQRTKEQIRLKVEFEYIEKE